MEGFERLPVKRLSTKLPSLHSGATSTATAAFALTNGRAVQPSMPRRIMASQEPAVGAPLRKLSPSRTARPKKRRTQPAFGARLPLEADVDVASWKWAKKDVEDVLRQQDIQPLQKKPRPPSKSTPRLVSSPRLTKLVNTYG